jgi:hypothetical protein
MKGRIIRKQDYKEGIVCEIVTRYEITVLVTKKDYKKLNAGQVIKFALKKRLKNPAFTGLNDKYLSNL